MGRRRHGVVSALSQMAKIAARQARQAELEARRRQAEQVRLERQLERENKAAAKEARERYLMLRELEVEDKNRQLEEQLAKLSGILEATLGVDDAISFDSLKLDASYPAFAAPAPLAKSAPRPVEADFVGAVKTPAWLLFLPWFAKRHAARLEAARVAYAEGLRSWDAGERSRLDALHKAQTEHQRLASAHAEQVARNHQEIEQFRRDYQAGKPEAILAYNTMVLERSAYPDSITTDFDVAYAADAAELAIDYELPSVSCIPAVGEYKFTKSKDSIDEKPRKPTQVRSLYQEIIAAICLRSIHEVFEADRQKQLRSVVFNGFACEVNPATGQDAELCLVSVRAQREAFLRLNLRRIDELACLKELGGELSSRPDQLVTVPVVAAYGSGEGKVEEVASGNAKKRARG